jgi:hypothetical protein
MRTKLAKGDVWEQDILIFLNKFRLQKLHYNMIEQIKTEEQYDKALDRAYELMQLDLNENSVQYGELENLSILIKQYEDEHYPIP